jgi:hypothetical protein
VGRTENKSQKALADDEKSMCYAQRKVKVKSLFSRIKGNRSFRRFSLRELEKVHTEFGIVALPPQSTEAAIRHTTLSKNKGEKWLERK